MILSLGGHCPHHRLYIGRTANSKEEFSLADVDRTRRPRMLDEDSLVTNSETEETLGISNTLDVETLTA